MLHHLLNNFEIPKCYQNKHRLIEIYSWDNLTKIKDKALTGLNSPNCIILDSRVFNNFKLANEPFARASRILETCVSFSNDLCQK